MGLRPDKWIAIVSVVLYACFIVEFVQSEFGNCNVPACRFTARRRHNDGSILNRYGKGMPTELIGLFLDVPRNAKKNGCFVNTTNILDTFNFTRQDVLRVVSLTCRIPIQLFLTEDGRAFDPESITYLQIEICEVDLREINKIWKVLDILSFVAHDALITNSHLNCLGKVKTNSNYCTMFVNTSVIWLDRPEDSSSDYVFQTLNCSEEFKDVRELTLGDMKWTVFPDFIQRVFPKIQSLELPGSSLTVPPPFPWNDGLVVHTRNMSRTPYFQEQYATNYHTYVSEIHHRRMLNLQRNKIKSLKNFQFKGFLHVLQIEENGLEEIGNNTFSNLRGLQHLNLRFNKLQEIPITTFRNLTDLRHINLANNLLTTLQDGLFDNNIHLQYINAANNSIETVGTRVFSKLANLTVIHLEFNSLKFISRNAFPSLTIALKVVFLNDNPLEHFPEGVLYLRKLEKVHLQNTYISFSNFTDWLFAIDYGRLAEAVVRSASGAHLDILDPDALRMVDMSGSKVENIFLDNYWGTTTLEKYKKGYLKSKLEAILTHFKFNLYNNPLACDCRIVPFNKFIEILIGEGKFKGTEYMFTDWKCTMPSELHGKPMLSIEEKDTYCRKSFAECPYQCTCHVRSITGIIIVDCRDTGLRELPQILPDGQLDLWFQNNNITSLPSRSYMKRTRQFYLSNNAINNVNPATVKLLVNVEEIFLDSNHFAKLPEEFKTVNAKTISIQNNPFTCDCNTLWMKKWLMQKRNVIQDALEVACNVDDENEDGKLFIAVPDEQFVCKEDFDSMKHVVVPSVVCSIAIALLLVCICLVYVFRLEVKVLLYIYFGIHPFDKDEKDCNEEIDVVIVHSHLITDWVMENIVHFLEEQGQKYVISEMSRDFVAGFSYQENISCMVKHSKRILIVLSKDMVSDDDLLKVAWNEAQDKIKELRTNYAMIVCYDVHIKEINNKDLRRYVKRGRYIDVKQGLFHEKIMYSMPQVKLDDYSVKSMPDMRSYILHMYGNDDINNDVFERHAFIAYSDKDMGYTMNELKPQLEDKDYTLCLPDRDFIPGASKEENVLKAVDNCMHTLFILSGDHLQDEWSLFTFRSASEKSLREKCNHLIVLTTNDTDFNNMDEEVRYYVKTHVTLNINENGFFDRLLKSLPPPDEYQPNLDGETNFVKFQNMMNGEVNRAFEMEDEKYIRYPDDMGQDCTNDEECECSDCLLKRIEQQKEDVNLCKEPNGRIDIDDKITLVNETEIIEMHKIRDT